MDKTNDSLITVIGGGSWATAIVKILSEGENSQIKWWLRNSEIADYITKFGHNPKYLSDVNINNDKVKVFTDIKEALSGSQYVILVIPAAFLQQSMSSLLIEDLKNKIVISGIKGMLPEKNILITDWLEQNFHVSAENIAVIAGPCHAEEVALEKQSYLTIASKNIQTASLFADLITCRYIHAFPSQDIYGIEYSAIMKNIIALACGITHGLGYGDNFQAVLVSNAMQEIKNFVDTLFPTYRDLTGSAYLGDLLVTAYSQFSRNRMFGNMIGRGYSVKSAQVEMNMIAEGYYAVKSVHEINIFYRLDMPIVSAVFNILYNNASPAREMMTLRERLR